MVVWEKNFHDRLELAPLVLEILATDRHSVVINLQDVAFKAQEHILFVGSMLKLNADTVIREEEQRVARQRDGFSSE